MSDIPAGWYPDPQYPRQPWTDEAQIPKRYHDGTDWTEQLQVPAPTSPGNPPTTLAQDAISLLTPMLIIGGILAFGLVLFAVIFH